MQRIILIDGNPLMWRAVYSQNENYVTEGILTYFFDILSKFDCSNVLVLWDKGKSRWRTTMYPEYKATREERKSKINLEEMGNQKEEAKRILEYFGVRNITVPGVEADDMIAWFAEYFSATHKVLIASRDKDLWQLISNKVTIFDPLTNTLVQPDDVQEELGITPNLIPDWKALVGDPSDNIKGVKGIGNKTALTLINEYGGISNLLDPENSKKLQAKRTTARVVDSSHDLEHSYQLVKLPVMGDMFHFMNDAEIEVLYEELYKTLDINALKAQVEMDLLGNTRIHRRFVADLFEELRIFKEWVSTEKACKGLGYPCLNLDALSDDLSTCCGCTMKHPSIRCQPIGPSNSNIMLLGKDITFDEPRMVFLEELLGDIEVKKSLCWITSVCKCPSGFSPLLYSSIEACSRFLKEELRLVQPKLIIAFGNEAMASTTPYKYGVLKHVGEIEKQTIGDYSCFVATLPDPIDIIRSPGKIADWNFGVDKIKEFLDEKRNK